MEIEQAEVQQEPSVNLSTDIFKYGTLINVGIGFWEGKVLQTQKDQEVLGNTIDYEIFAPGYKWLVPSKYTRIFSSYRSRLNSYFEKMSLVDLNGRVIQQKNIYIIPSEFCIDSFVFYSIAWICPVGFKGISTAFL